MSTHTARPVYSGHGVKVPPVCFVDTVIPMLLLCCVVVVYLEDCFSTSESCFAMRSYCDQ
jgi:hypothetical protein